MTDENHSATYRILDAAANRAGEGLRTLEEFARFTLDDAEITASFKSLRHDLTAVLNRFDRTSLLQSRNTPGDVGTEIRESSEYARTHPSAVIAAAAARTQQSLRVLEEYGKTIDASAAAELEQIRYRCYTLAADLELRGDVQQRQDTLATSHLYVLVDAGPSENAFVELLNRLFDDNLGCPVDMVQLRDRSVDDRTLLQRSKVGVALARQHGKLFIINDRCDLAVAASTDGVHVGQDEMPVLEARKIIGPSRLVGVSTHSIDQARQAVADGADYIGCGPVFPGRTKQFEAYVGTPFLKQVSEEIKIPAFAIGGIDHSNVQQVTQAGMHRIAVTGAVRDADDPGQAAAQLKSHL